MRKIIILSLTFLLAALTTQLLAQEEEVDKQTKLDMLKEKLAAKGIDVTFHEPGELEEKNIHPFILKHRNNQLPNFTLTDLEGNKVESSQLTGKYIHINFWSITCAPCIQEFPELDQIKEKYGDKDVVYLAIAAESEEKVKKVLKKHPLNYTVIANGESLFENLGIDGYPKNFFIDPSGKIIEVTDGTTYTIEILDEESKLVPDNFKVYDEIMSRMISTSESNTKS